MVEFYPVLNQECEEIVHLDLDTLFVSKVDLRPCGRVNRADAKHDWGS